MRSSVGRRNARGPKNGARRHKSQRLKSSGGQFRSREFKSNAGHLRSRELKSNVGHLNNLRGPKSNDSLLRRPDQKCSKRRGLKGRLPLPVGDPARKKGSRNKRGVGADPASTGLTEQEGK